MRQLIITEVEGLKEQSLLYRTLKKLLDGVNVFIASTVAGTATLVAGVVTVQVPLLLTTSVVQPAYQTLIGTTGTLYADSVDYNLTSKTFKIRSSSATDNSVVTWLVMN